MGALCPAFLGIIIPHVCTYSRQSRHSHHTIHIRHAIDVPNRSPKSPRTLRKTGTPIFGMCRWESRPLPVLGKVKITHISSAFTCAALGCSQVSCARYMTSADLSGAMFHLSMHRKPNLFAHTRTLYVCAQVRVTTHPKRVPTRFFAHPNKHSYALCVSGCRKHFRADGNSTSPTYLCTIIRVCAIHRHHPSKILHTCGVQADFFLCLHIRANLKSSALE